MRKTGKHIVSKVLPGSIAEELEIEPGDELVSVSGKEIEDILDYHYLMNDEYVELLIRKPNGEEWELEIEKDVDEDLGIDFGKGLMDEYHSCHNKCIFCFIDQLPKGMRETMYFKDDDSRLSFLQGNYITMTNMKDEALERIIRYKLEPINGDELERSIRDLSGFIPNIESVSVVPVGLSDHREGLYPLEPFNREDAREVIACIEKWQKKLYEEYGTHFIHASDEWYLLAGYEMPEE